MIADDGVSQDKIASSINDQSEETDRRSRNEAILGYDGADQSGSATATSTRLRRRGQPRPVVAVQTHIVKDINDAVRVKYQKEQVEAINEAAARSNVVEDDTNPLYCIVCTNVVAKESDMRGFQCNIRKHYVCRTCWARIDTKSCLQCRQRCGRYLRNADCLL